MLAFNFAYAESREAPSEETLRLARECSFAWLKGQGKMAKIMRESHKSEAPGVPFFKLCPLHVWSFLGQLKQ